MGVILSAFLLPKMAFWGDLGSFEGFGCEFPHEKEESGLERKKMGKNTVSVSSDTFANLKNITIQ